MFRPVGDRLLVQRTPEKNVTESGLELVNKKKEGLVTGRVLAVPEAWPESVKTRYAKGDLLVFTRFAGQAVEEVLTGEPDCVLLRMDHEVLAKLGGSDD